jgi:hypothetical protein
MLDEDVDEDAESTSRSDEEIPIPDAPFRALSDPRYPSPEL